MKCIAGKVIIKLPNDKAWQNEIDFGNGQKLYIEGSLRVEHYAHSIGEVVVSGVDGLMTGEKVGLSYQALCNYDWVDCHGKVTMVPEKAVARVFHNQFEHEGETLFTIEKEHILCKISDEKYDGFGDWVLMKSIKHESTGIIKTLGSDTRTDTNIEQGVGVYVSGDLPVKEGAILLFAEKFRSEYEFGYNNKFIVLKKDYINAVRN